MKRSYFYKLSLIILGFAIYIFSPNYVMATSLTDSFTGTTINTSKWTEYENGGAGDGGSSGNVQQNGTLTISGNNGWNTNGLKSVSTFDRTVADIVIEYDWKMSDCTATNAGVMYGDWVTGSLQSGTIIFNRLSNQFRLFAYSTSVTVSGTCTNNTTIHVKLVVKQAGGVDVYLNGSETPDGSLTAVQAPSSFNNKNILLEQYATGATLTFDNLTVTQPVETVPGMPTNLVATAGDEEVALSWTAPSSDGNSAITDYLVEYKLTSASTWTTFSDGVSTNTSATVTGLTNDLSYDFRVSAVNAVGTGDPSDTSLLSENFTGTTIDTSKWNEYEDGISGDGGSSGDVQQNGLLTITGNGKWNNTGLESSDTFSRSSENIIIEYDWKMGDCTATNAGLMYGDWVTNSLQTGTIIFNRISGVYQLFAYPTNKAISGVSCTNNSTIHVKLVIKQAGGVDVYLNGSETPNGSLTAVQAPSSFNNKNILLEQYANGVSLNFDNLVIYTPSSTSVSATPFTSTPEAPGVPTSLGAVPGDGQASLYWSAPSSDGNSDITDYVIEYKLTSASTWTTFSDGVSTNTSATVTGLTNNLSYNFRVSATNAIGTGNPSNTATVTYLSGTSYFNHILSTGQSLSTGTNGAPALTTTQPYSNKMLSGTSLVDLIESSVETMSSALANTITSLSPNDYFQSAVTRHGYGGYAYSQLKKGTDRYALGITQATYVKNAADLLGLTDRVIGVTTIHGESDHLADNGAVYQSYLEEWQSDYNTDVKAITGQTSDIPLFTDQMSSHTGYSDATSLIPIAQLSAAEDNPGTIILIGPKYFFEYSDGAHLTNESYRWLGEYYGKVIKKVVLDNETWTPLSPEQVIRIANVIYADFHVPEGPLAFDTTNVSSRTNYGFEYYDTTSSASISSVEIVDDEVVKITLNTTPTGSNQRLRYAYTGVPGTRPGAQYDGSAGGNLRDSDSTASLYGNNLYNWAVHFDKAISIDSTNPSFSSVTATPGNSSATVTWTTNEFANSKVQFSPVSTLIAESSLDSDLATSHSVSLSGLQACTKYYYKVVSEDRSGNTGTSTLSSFRTTGCTGDTTVLDETEGAITSSGGSINLLSSGDGVALTVPADYKSGVSSSYFQIKQLSKTDFLSTASTPTDKTLVENYIYNLKSLPTATTTISSFDDALTVTITYSDSDISGLDESTLAIYRYNGSVWNVLTNCVVDASANSVACETSNFSDFGLFGEESSTPDPDPDPDPDPEPDPEPEVVSVASATGGGLHLGCGDPNALNYEKFASHRQNLCEYGEGSAQSFVSTNSFTRDLELGFAGEDVKALQKLLNQLGFTVSTSGPGSVGNETDYFGSATQNALIRYQKANGITPAVGYFGPITRGSFAQNSSQNQNQNQDQNQDQTQNQTQTQANFTRDLKLGFAGEDVKALQKLLNQLGFTVSTSGPGSVGNETDYFGSATQNALIRYQKANGITPAVGYFGPITRGSFAQN